MLFLDTTVLAGAADANDACHGDGKRILQAVASGKFGMALTSDYVLDETLTILAVKRRLGAAKAVAFVRLLLASPRVRLLTVDHDEFQRVLDDFASLGSKGLGFTDSASVSLMRLHGCTQIASHDHGFDQIPGLQRVEQA